MRVQQIGGRMITLGVLHAVAACSSFGTAEEPPAAGSDAGTTPATPVVADGGPVDADAATVDGGCGRRPFVGRFTSPDPLSEGWENIAFYGPQGDLSVAQAAGANDGVLRVRSSTATSGRGKVFYRGLDTNLACAGFEMRFRVEQIPLGALGVVTTVLRFASEHWVGLTITPNGMLEVAQQTTPGDAYQALGRVPLSKDAWHVARIVYRAGPEVEASLDGAAIPLDLNPLYPMAGPSRFDVGVTYAAPESVIRFDVDEVTQL